MTGAEALAVLLRMWGYSTIFAYPGTSELALCAALDRQDGLVVVNARGDKETAFMAAGGNLPGEPGCAAVLHGARGLTNALGAVADVRRSEISVLYLVGLPSRASAPFLPPHGEPGLIDSAGAFAKCAADCSTLAGDDPSAYIKIITEALAAVNESPSGPVLLGVPQDLLFSRFVPLEALAEANPTAPTRPEPPIAEALALLRRAKRPVVLVDDYLFRSPAGEATLAEFAALVSAPVFQVAYRRGPMLFQQVRPERVATFLGPYDARNGQHRRILTSADLLVTVEDRNMYPRVVGSLPTCDKIAITSNVASTVKNGYLRSSDVLVSGEAGRSLRRIAQELGPFQDPWSNTRQGEDWPPLPLVAEALRRDEPPCCESAVELVRAIARGLSTVDHPMIVDDSQMLGGLVSAHYSCLPNSIRVFGSHGGFVGGGLATAVGLATAHRDLGVLALVGDQGFTNGLQALAAASEHRAPLVILVCNNGASVSLRRQADFDGLGASGQSVLGNVERMNYAAIAEGFGLTAIVERWPDETRRSDAVAAASDRLASEIGRALLTRQPYLIEVVTPSCPEFWAGVWRTDGFEDEPGSAP
jgi:acetolactate synthase-1/2/3 large subunit